MLVKEGPMPLFLLLLLLAPVSASAKELGELSANPYQQNSTANPYGAGSPFGRTGSTILSVLTAARSAINQRRTISPPMRHGFTMGREITAAS